MKKTGQARKLEDLLVQDLLVQAIRLAKTSPDGNAILACAMQQAGFPEIGSISLESLACLESPDPARQDIIVHDTIVELFRQARICPDGRSTVDHALLQTGISKQCAIRQEMIEAKNDAEATGTGSGQGNTGDIKDPLVHDMLVNLFCLAMTCPDGSGIIARAMLCAGTPDDFPVLPEWKNLNPAPEPEFKSKPELKPESEPEPEFGPCFQIPVIFRKKRNPARGMVVIEKNETTGLNTMFLTFPAGTPILRSQDPKFGNNLE